MLPFLEDHRKPTPRWLREITAEGVGKGPERWMDRFLQEAVFYPGAGKDTSLLRQMEGVAHAFLYVDFSHSLDQVKEALLTLTDDQLGPTDYQLLAMAEFDPAPFLVGASWHPPRPLDAWQQQSYGFWAVLARPGRRGRFAFMALGAEGMTALSALYPSTPPRGLVVHEYAFDHNPWGEWSGPLTRFAGEHWATPPEWQIAGNRAAFQHRGGDYEWLGSDQAVESMHRSVRGIGRFKPRAG